MRLALGLAIALLSTPAMAAHWAVDNAKSKLGFSVVWAGAPYVAVFKTWTANIDFDPANLKAAHAVVTIDLASETSDAPDNDQGVKGAQGFAVSQFPTAKFETTGFSHGAGNAYVANGKLTIKGITKAIALPFTLQIAGKTAHMVGHADVMRPDFGLAGGEWAGETPIAHRVTVDIDLTASH